MMDTSQEKVILGLFVLDKIITTHSPSSFTKQDNRIDFSLGGPPTFMLFFSDILGTFFPIIKSPTVFSHISPETKDFHEEFSFISQAQVQFINYEKTPKFILDYSQGSPERKLVLYDPPDDFKFESFNWNFHHPPILIISSIYQEFNSIKTFSFFRERGSFLAFDPQGCFRERLSNGEIRYSEWLEKDIISQLDCIKLSKNEAELLGLGYDEVEIIKKLLNISPKFVIITKGKKGSLLGVRYTGSEKSKIFYIPPFPVENVKTETGAGDGFLYCFISFLQLLNDELAAIAYATSLISLFLEHGLDKEKFTLQEIKYRQKLIHSKIRNILD